MSDSFYVGDYVDDGLNGPNRGWIMGSFMGAAPRKNENVEIKY